LLQFAACGFIGQIAFNDEKMQLKLIEVRLPTDGMEPPVYGNTQEKMGPNVQPFGTLKLHT